MATCPVVEAEALWSTRTAVELRLERRVHAGRELLLVEPQDWDRALDVQGELWGRGHVRAVGLEDLLIAAVAQRSRVIVLHCDSDFDLVGGRHRAADALDRPAWHRGLMALPTVEEVELLWLAASASLGHPPGTAELYRGVYAAVREARTTLWSPSATRSADCWASRTGRPGGGSTRTTRGRASCGSGSAPRPPPSSRARSRSTCSPATPTPPAPASAAPCCGACSPAPARPRRPAGGVAADR